MNKLEKIALEKKQKYEELSSRFQVFVKTFEKLCKNVEKLEKDLQENGAQEESVFLSNSLLDATLRLSVIDEMLCCRIERLLDPEDKPMSCRLCKRVNII